VAVTKAAFAASKAAEAEWYAKSALCN
jgi:hypothetical protein